MSNGFGLEPLKVEGAPLHPQHISYTGTEEQDRQQARYYFNDLLRRGYDREILKQMPLWEVMEDDARQNS